MNTITILSSVALTTIGLALIHESRLATGSDSMLCRVVQFLCGNAKAEDHARVGE